MLKAIFNYNQEDPDAGELIVRSSVNIDSFDYRAELIGSSAAAYQLPRLTVTMTIKYNANDLYDDVSYYFRREAKKGHKVRFTETDAAPDPLFPDQDYPVDKEFYFILESFSLAEEDQLVNVVLTNLDIDSEAIVQYGGKQTPLDFSAETLSDLGLKNVSRLPIAVDGRQNMICVSTTEETLMALAWAFDNKRHNIGFAPAAGVTETGKLILVPLPGDLEDGVPKYSIEPEYVVDKVVQEPEVIVTDLKTGSLESGNLVPVVTPISAVTSKTKPLTDAVKIYSTDGKLNAWAICTGLSEDYYSKDSVILGSKLEIPHFTADRIITITPGYYRQGSYNIPKPGWWILRGSGNSLSVSFIDKDKYQWYSTTGRLTGIQVLMSLNPNDHEKAVGSFDEITIDPDNGTTLILAPMIGSQSSYSSNVPFAIIKTVNAYGVPTFKGVSGGTDYDDEFRGMYPIKAYRFDDEGSYPVQRTAYVLVVSSGYSLADGRVWAFSKEGDFQATYPITGVTLPSGTTGNWDDAKYIDWNDRDDGVVGAYCVYTMPSTNAGKTIVCFQLFTDSSGIPVQADTKYSIEVTDLIGVDSSGRDDPLIIVTKSGWTAYDTRTVQGSWFKVISQGSTERWKGIDEMYNGKGDSFVLSEPVSETSSSKTRTVYIMQGANPFELYSLSDRKVTHNLVSEVNANSRDISFVIDLPALSGGSNIPKLGKKTEIEVTNFKWKLNTSDSWTVEDVTKLATPLLGTLCRYKLYDTDSDYKVALISKVHMWWDGLTRLAITVVDVDSPLSIY